MGNDSSGGAIFCSCLERGWGFFFFGEFFSPVLPDYLVVYAGREAVAWDMIFDSGIW